MKIFDCFMFFDEESVLDLRLNVLNKYVEKFIITEATYMHSGKAKKLVFDINKFKKFKDKIIYNVLNEEPKNIEKISNEDDKYIRGSKLINNSLKRENFQRQFAQKYLDVAGPNDLIIINDIDEIPNLENIDFSNINEKLIIFKQKIFYYKFNLLYENLIWHGSKACLKKHFISPQWLRNVRHKKYPFWRLDTLFSKTRYNDIHYVENGGWHFTNIKSPENLEKKFSNFLHHQDYEASGLGLNDVKQMVENKKVLYDLGIDKRGYKWKGDKSLKKVSLSEMPEYLNKNAAKYSKWLEN